MKTEFLANNDSEYAIFYNSSKVERFMLPIPKRVVRKYDGGQEENGAIQTERNC